MQSHLFVKQTWVINASSALTSSKKGLLSNAATPHYCYRCALMPAGLGRLHWWLPGTAIPHCNADLEGKPEAAASDLWLPIQFYLTVEVIC